MTLRLRKMRNFILRTDAYKYSHKFQYPVQSGYISSYIEARGGEYKFTQMVGLQYYLYNLIDNPITIEDIDEAEVDVIGMGLPFDREPWEIIVKEYGGLPPVRIEAVPEGLRVPVKNVLVQIMNTDPRFFWLPSFMETDMQRAVWYPTTVSTRSRMGKIVIEKFMTETADSLEGLPFKLHDFGARGTTASESSAVGGFGHLVNFMGTDTVEAIPFARLYYDTPGAGFSIPAAEHSTATSWGPDREEEFARHMLNVFPGPLIAVVSDSYDYFNMVENIWFGSLRDEVRESGKTIVIRPDSGNPVDVVLGTFALAEKKLDDVYVNTKGYKMLPNYYRLIWGDGIDLKGIEAVLQAMKDAGWSADNIAFGMGGGLLQKLNRDTQKFAMKASAAQFGDEPWKDIFKSPATDPGKKSKKGILALEEVNGEFRTVRKSEAANNVMRQVYHNGHMTNIITLTEMRELADK